MSRPHQLAIVSPIAAGGYSYFIVCWIRGLEELNEECIASNEILVLRKECRKAYTLCIAVEGISIDVKEGRKYHNRILQLFSPNIQSTANVQRMKNDYRNRKYIST